MNGKDWIEQLNQLRSLWKEVDELSQRIARLQEKRAEDARTQSALKTMCDLLDARRAYCMETVGHLYSFIDDIPDSLTRRVFAARYIDGMTWMQVAFRVGEYDEQVPRRIHNRYLQNLQFDENDEARSL